MTLPSVMSQKGKKFLLFLLFKGTLRTFVDVVSARTAVGHDAEGRLVLVQLDGQTRQRG